MDGLIKVPVKTITTIRMKMLMIMINIMMTIATTMMRIMATLAILSFRESS